MQYLISAGHSWRDIQGYTPAEIGIFFRAVCTANKPIERKPGARHTGGDAWGRLAERFGQNPPRRKA